MTTLLRKNYPRTLDHLPADTMAAWLFEDASERARISALWQERGGNIRLYSAYKTLLCAIGENALLADTDSIEIYYPVVEGDDPARFRLECYPLPDLYPHCVMRFTPRYFLHSSRPYYSLHYPDGTHLDIPVPVRWRQGADGREILAACGWIERSDGSSAALFTDYEALYEDACACLANIPLTPLPGAQAHGPFFERLRLDITLPMQDMPLPLGEEHLSLAEALHEDLYFSALDIFCRRLGLAADGQTFTPGQILPVIRRGESLSLHIHTEENPRTWEPPLWCSDLAQAGHWLGGREINAHLAALGGETFSCTSRQGRECSGIVVRGQSRGSMAISAGQHGNESSGIVGALRAAYFLKKEGKISYSLRPLGNPDGYAAFAELCRHHPRHMHHGARYTALGCDVAERGALENSLCRDARALLPDAWLHLNLHGYPAHEWAVPLSGYVPRGFSRWTIPKGFFLICRYHPAWKIQARILMDALLRAVARFPAQLAQNQMMLMRYRHIVGEPDFAIAHEAIPYVMEMCDDGAYPVEIITEAPDETVYGESFRIAHESHYRVVLAAARHVLSQILNKNSQHKRKTS